MAKAKTLDKVRYGFIGAGAIAQRRHLPEAQSNPRAVVAAVADTAADRVRDVADYFGAAAYTDYRQMLAEAEIDAVVVAGPNALHAAMSIEALETGRHVLCEKPMATTVEEARRMIDAAQAAGKRLMIAMNQRFMPQHLRAKQLIESGRLGRVLTFRTVFTHSGPENWSVEGAQTWFLDKASAGFGVLGDLGVHKIDLMRWLTGEEIVEVRGEVTTLDKRRPDGNLIELDDNAHLVLRTAGGVLGSMFLSFTHYGTPERHTLIACEGGVMGIGLDPSDQVVVEFRNGDREAYRFTGVGATGWPVRSGVIDAFTDCIITGEPTPVGGEEGLRSLEVLHAAVQAAWSDTNVRLRPC